MGLLLDQVSITKQKIMSQNQIRPIAICVFRHHNRILVFEGYDSVKNELFYRPLGGGIEFGEHSSEAIQREIKEELGAEVCDLSFLGSVENIFFINNRRGHEFVQVYDAKFRDPKFYNNHSFEATEANGSKLKVMWKDIKFFEKGEIPLYPTGLLELLKEKSR